MIRQDHEASRNSPAYGQGVPIHRHQEEGGGKLSFFSVYILWRFLSFLDLVFTCKFTVSPTLISRFFLCSLPVTTTPTITVVETAYEHAFTLCPIKQ